MDGFFPGIETLDPVTQAALLKTAEETGVLIWRRCAMPSHARASICIWRHRPVTASIKGSLPNFNSAALITLFKETLLIWNECANIGLVWTDDWMNANIRAETKRIDGASGTLAFSYLPPCGVTSTNNVKLQQVYDTSEGWTRNLLTDVMLHEEGHAIGLDHINNKNALMNPYASSTILRPTKHEIDIVVPLYGPPVTGPAPGPYLHRGGVILGPGGLPHRFEANGIFSDGARNYKVGVTAL